MPYDRRAEGRTTLLEDRRPHRRAARGFAYAVRAQGDGTVFTREFVFPIRHLAFAILDVELRPKVENESATALANLKRHLEQPTSPPAR